MTRFSILLLCSALLSGCASSDSHLPNPLTLPAHALNAGLNNAFYNARRGRVSDYVVEHQDRIMADVARGGGPFFLKVMHIARVRPPSQPALLAVLQEDQQLYTQSTEPLVVAIMVHAD